jgi:hypothetical protein
MVPEETSTAASLGDIRVLTTSLLRACRATDAASITTEHVEASWNAHANQGAGDGVESATALELEVELRQGD